MKTKNTTTILVISMMQIGFIASQCGHIRHKHINEIELLKGDQSTAGTSYSLSSFNSGSCFSLNFWLKASGSYSEGENHEIANSGTFSISVSEENGILKISLKNFETNSKVTKTISKEKWIFFSLISDTDTPQFKISLLDLETLAETGSTHLESLSLNPAKNLKIGTSNPRNFKGEISGVFLTQSCLLSNPEIYYSASHYPFFKASYLLGKTPYDYLNNIAKADGKPRLVIGEDYTDSNRPDIMPDNANPMTGQHYFLMKSNSFLHLPRQTFKMKSENNLIYWMNFRLFTKWTSFPSPGNKFEFFSIEEGGSKIRFGMKNDGNICLIKEDGSEITGVALKSVTLGSRTDLGGLIGFGPNSIMIVIGSVKEVVQSKY